MGFWTPPWYTDEIWPYGPRPFGPFLKRKSPFCDSESTWKSENNTSEIFFLSLWPLRYIFCTQSLDHWPMFIFIKMTHGAICTQLWVTWLWIVHTKYEINSDRDPKNSNFFRGPPELIQCHFPCHHSSLTFFELIVGDLADRCWRGIYMFVKMSWFAKNHSSL